MLNLLSSLYLFLARAAAVILQLRFVEHWFGPSYSGLNVLLNQVTYYVLIAEFGLAAATLSLLFEPVHRGDHARTAALVTALRRAVHRIVILAAPVAVIVLALYGLRLRHQLPYAVVLAAFLFAAASSLITLLALPYQSYLNAADRIFESNLVLGTGFLVKTAVGLSAARATHHYLALLLTFPCVSLLELLVLRTRFQRLMPGVSPGSLEQAARDIRNKAKFVVMHRIGGLVYYQSDFIILSLAASLSAVGAYAQYQYIAAGLIGLFTACTTAMTTKVAREQMGMKPAQRIRFYGVTSRLFLFAAAACGILFLATARNLVQIIFHTHPLTGAVPALLAGLLLLNLARTGDDIWVNASGAFEVGYTFPLYESALYIALGVALVRELGIAGILLAGIATNLVFSVGLRLYVLSRGVFQVGILVVAAARIRALGPALLFAAPLLLLLLPWQLTAQSAAVQIGAVFLLAGPFVIAMLFWLFTDSRAVMSVSTGATHEAVS